jgi:hypothetical protein
MRAAQACPLDAALDIVNAKTKKIVAGLRATAPRRRAPRVIRARAPERARRLRRPTLGAAHQMERSF